VLGATPGGIAAAVRAARDGPDTVLVTYNARVGGMMASGSSFTDTTLGTDPRAPLHDEFFERVEAHYRETYGPDSQQVADCDGGLRFEPTVAEGVFEALLDDAGVRVHREYHPTGAERDGRSLEAVRFEPFGGGAGVRVVADAFVEATYEGDLAARAGVPYRLGRESRAAYGEQYAGRLFSEKGTRLYPGSTGVGDDAVQSYDYRLCLTDDPDNRMPIEKPAGYDREEFLPVVEDPPEADGDVPAWDSEEYPCRLKSELVRPTREAAIERGFAGLNLLRGPLPNGKRDLNTADLPGEADAYPEADWETRREIADRHRRHVLGLLYFFQNDGHVPDPIQEESPR
jgi:hypothetical protein